jgi:hypothetical protein
LLDERVMKEQKMVWLTLNLDCTKL